jgi:hypothetical protein
MFLTADQPGFQIRVASGGAFRTFFLEVFDSFFPQFIIFCENFKAILIIESYGNRCIFYRDN